MKIKDIENYEKMARCARRIKEGYGVEMKIVKGWKFNLYGEDTPIAVLEDQHGVRYPYEDILVLLDFMENLKNPRQH